MGLKNDGKYYIAPFEDVFNKAYESNWIKLMENTYFDSEKLDVGHKLRPRLVYWGFLLNKPDPTPEDFDSIGKLAVAVELIHKASLLLDDFIDKDTSRHGQTAFYLEYGVERAIIYSLNILSLALKTTNEVFAYKQNSELYFNSMFSIISTLESMTYGVLKELDLETVNTHSINSIKEIMLLETSELIISSLISGYSLADGNNKVAISCLKRLGKKVGFIFQTINDLEPFFESEHSHKGSLNIDVSRDRKNYCVALLNEFLSKKEKELISSSDSGQLEDLILNLCDKYNIKSRLLQECNTIVKNIRDEIHNVEFFSIYKEEFAIFIESVYYVSKNRLN